MFTRPILEMAAAFIHPQLNYMITNYLTGQDGLVFE